MEIEQYIEFAQSFNALSFQGVYLVALPSGKCLYHSSHPLLLCDMPEQDLIDHGISALKKIILEEDLGMTADMANSIKKTYSYIPLEYKRELMTSINLNVKYRNQYIAVNHRLSSLRFDNTGTPSLLLGLVSPMAYKKCSSIIASIPSTDLHFQFNRQNKTWEPLNLPHFSENEKTMLRMSMSGLSLNDICRIMHKSIDTVRYYRKQVFQKCNAHTTSEAITYALQYGIV